MTNIPKLVFSNPRDKHTGFLSNEYRKNFKLDGITYKTVIHYLYSKLFEGLLRPNFLQTYATFHTPSYPPGLLL